MKKIVLLLAFLLGISNTITAQKAIASPPEVATGSINQAAITIKYGSPSVKGRKIWGGLVPFNEVWRAGANEATTFETDKDLTIEGNKLPAGKYSFFIIPSEKECVIIFNKDAKQWGAYSYKENKDQLRIKVAPTAKPDSTEKLLYTIANNKVALVWEKWEIGFKVE